MRLWITSICAAAAFAVPGAFAASPQCPLTYETFESAVPHIDLEECPEPGMADTAFCRVSAGGEQLHLFYFSLKEDQCLLQVRSFDEEDYTLSLKER